MGGIVELGFQAPAKAASFGVCIFLHSLMSVITIIMVWTPWTDVLRPDREPGG